MDFREHDCANGAEVREAAADADVVWLVGGSCVLTPEVLPHLRRCQVILRTGTGTDNIPIAEATRLGIVVANTPEATASAVAEHTIGLLFAVLRRIAVQDRAVRQGVWDRHRAWPDWHMAGRTLGLIGFGRIARLVLRKTSGLEMTTIAHDPAIRPALMASVGVEAVSLEELLRRADFVSINVPLVEATRHLIGERELRRMKPQAVLINTARGPLVDEQALVKERSPRPRAKRTA